jgi:serine O-acetyltransferase
MTVQVSLPNGTAITTAPKASVSTSAMQDNAAATDDLLFLRLRREAQETLDREPELCNLLYKTVLGADVTNFRDAIAATVSYRLSPVSSQQDFCPDALKRILTTAMYDDDTLEHGHTMAEAVRADALAVLDRDPAAQTLLEVVLFYKGFSALVSHRAARRKWFADSTATGSGIAPPHRSMTALFLQSQASAVFGLDIHPGATIGAGVFFDHGTGIVVGEAAWIGDGCTILHGVTLGTF